MIHQFITILTFTGMLSVGSLAFAAGTGELQAFSAAIPEHVFFAVAGAVALALFTVRRSLEAPSHEKKRYAILVGVALVLGLVVGLALRAVFDGAPIWLFAVMGSVCGVALVEVGALLIKTLKAALGALAKRLE